MRHSSHSTHTPTRRGAPPRVSGHDSAPAPGALKTLLADHRNFQELLRVFEAELARFHDADAPVDYPLMRDIMHYVTNYPDRVHHPMEDLVAECLLPMEPAARAPVAELRAEHEWLTATGTELLHLLEEIISDAMIPRDAVDSLARAYVERIRAHMDKEEATLFPMAARHLSAGDWAAITAAGHELSDPLFGNTPTDQTYRAIRDRLSGPH